MRVSTFSRASVIAISIFAVAFLITMYQVASTLASSRDHLAQYQELKSLTTVDFYRTISRYLQTGNASLLNEAENQLDQINQRTEKLAIQTFTASIYAKTQKLQQDINEKYRAWGKLSGDPLALLRNGEQGLVANIHQLNQYAEQSSALTPSELTHYLVTTGNISELLHQIINTREKLFLQTNTDSSHIEQLLTELNQATQILNTFPLLGISDDTSNEDEDDLLFDDEDESIDLSEEARNEFISLAKRYKRELTNTITQQQQRQQGLLLLNKDVSDMEAIILTGEEHIITEQKSINTNITWVVIVLMSFLVLFLATNYWLTRSVVLKPLRQLRDSFVSLVNDGRVDVITGIPEKTELGQISASFNNMVTKLAEEDKQKATQLNLVSSAMKTMESQAQTILDSSSSTSKHLLSTDEIMQALSQVTDNVNTLSQQVVENAQATQQSMNDSQTKVTEVLSASEVTNQAANEGKAAIESLSQSVESVGLIVDVISSIADQTNLLALNAAIEAARAGEHGRGFSVVADEVRQLAGKTQESLSQVSERLEQLNQASNALQQNIYGIEKASSQQQDIAELLKGNAATVVTQAIKSADVAKETLEQINQQRYHFTQFETAMQNVNDEVNQSRHLAETISRDVAEQVTDISQTLQLAS